MSSFLSARSFARLDLLSLVLDHGSMGSSVLLQHHACLGLFLSALGMSKLGFSLLIFDAGHLGFPMFIRSFCHSDSAALTLEAATIGPFSFLHFSARLELVLSVPRYTETGSFLSLRQFTWPGSILLVPGVTCCEPLLPLLDPGFSGSSLSVRSPARTEPLIPVSRFSDPEPSAPLRSYSCMDLLILIMGLGCVDFILSVLDPLHLDFFLPLHSSAHLGFVVLALECSSLDFLLPVRSFARSGSLLPVLFAHHLGSALLPQSPARMGLAVSAPGVCCLGSSSLIFGAVHLESLIFVRSFAQPELLLPILRFAHIELIPLPRSMG